MDSILSNSSLGDLLSRTPSLRSALETAEYRASSKMERASGPPRVVASGESGRSLGSVGDDPTSFTTPPLQMLPEFASECASPQRRASRLRHETVLNEPPSVPPLNPRRLWSREPTTPEEQILAPYNPMSASTQRTPQTLPMLTPDSTPASTSQSCGVEPPCARELTPEVQRVESTRRLNRVRRKPVLPGSQYLQPSPVLQSPSSAGSSLLRTAAYSTPDLDGADWRPPSSATCAFCDMPVDATFQAEDIVRMQCGHLAHSECRESLLSLSQELGGVGNPSIACMICDAADYQTAPATTATPHKKTPVATSAAFMGVAATQSSSIPAKPILTPLAAALGSEGDENGGKQCGSDGSGDGSGGSGGSSGRSDCFSGISSAVSQELYTYPSLPCGSPVSPSSSSSSSYKRTTPQLSDTDAVAGENPPLRSRTSCLSLSSRISLWGSDEELSPLTDCVLRNYMSSPTSRPSSACSSARSTPALSESPNLDSGSAADGDSRSLYHRVINTMFDSHPDSVITVDVDGVNSEEDGSNFFVPENDNSYQLRVHSFATLPQQKGHTKRSRVAIWVQALRKAAPPRRTERTPKLAPRFASITSYRSTSRDLQHGLALKRNLRSLKYHGKPLKSLPLGPLRFHSCVDVTSSKFEPQIRWSKVTAYLFRDYLILVADRQRVKAVLDMGRLLESAFVSSEDPTLVIIRPKLMDFPELHFHTGSAAAAYLWESCLADPEAQFPLHPESYGSHLKGLKEVLRTTTGKTTLESAPRQHFVVLCVPYFLISSSLLMQQSVLETLRGLQPQDQLALVVYSASQIWKTIPFQPPSWPGWRHALENLCEETGGRGHGTARDQTAGPQPAADGHEFVTLNRNASKKRDSSGGKPLAELALNASAQLLKPELNLATAKDRAKGNVAGSIIFLSNDDTKLGGHLSSWIVEHSVAIQAVGITENHDAMTLSTLARNTGGTYIYAKDMDSIGLVLRKLAQAESQCVTQNVVLKMRPRIGADVSNFRLTAMDRKPRRVSTPGSSNRYVEVSLGRMGVGDVKSFVFDVEGDLRHEQPALQVTVEAANTSRTCPASRSFRINIPAAVDSESPSQRSYAQERNVLDLQCSMIYAFSALENALAGMITESNRQAFQALSRGIDNFKDTMRDIEETESPIRKIYEIFVDIFDQQCDAIIEHKLLTKDFVLESLQRVWLVHTKRGFVAKDELEKVFLL